MTDMPHYLAGADNNGKPRTDYRDRLQKMDEPQLAKECELKIWLSAYASNNARSDYHWHADACYDECQRRGRPDIYADAWNRAAG
jgi:hypothetical protein